MASARFGLVGKALRVLRDEGPRMMLARGFAKLSGMFGHASTNMLVATADAAAVDWTMPPAPLREPIVVRDRPARIAWITSPPGPESGGHHNMFRFIKFAEAAGHPTTVHVYDQHGASIESVRSTLERTSAYPDLDAEIRMYDPVEGVGRDVDAIFATGWETAYPAFLDPSHARRFYFVQDFEPSFYPVGTEYVLAENTYRFGFHGITAGRWLSERLHADYGMPTDHFDFAVDKSLYHVTDEGPRDEVFFYARPVTPRRAFEFGLLALADFAGMRPDVTINLAGWDVAGWEIPFAHRNLASLDISALNALYNRCAAGLVLSLSNMSLLPMELMASGVTPVINDAPNNRVVFDDPAIEWVPPSPLAIARRLVEVVDRTDNTERARRMSESITQSDWAPSGAQFLAAFDRAMRG